MLRHCCVCNKVFIFGHWINLLIPKDIELTTTLCNICKVDGAKNMEVVLCEKQLNANVVLN